MANSQNKINWHLLNLAAALMFFSCNDNTTLKPGAVEPKPGYLPPFTVLLDTCPPPKTTRLKDVPKPKVIPVVRNSANANKIGTAMGGEHTQFSASLVSKLAQPDALFTNFNTEHGLPVPFIRGGLMDKKGRLWFWTNGGGVTSYDGTGFNSFLNGLGIRCVAEDKRGWLWFANNTEGAICYDGVRFTNYTTKEGLADNTIFDIISTKDGSLWFATANGASRFDGTSFVTIKPSNDPLANNVNMIAEDKLGNIWLVLFGGGLCRYNGRDFELYTTKDGLPTNNMICMLEDSKGNFWFGSLEKGICRFDGKTFTIINLDSKPENNTVIDIEEDGNGDIWFATGGAGAIRYDRTEFTHFTTDLGLPSNVINNIVKDKHGNLWFATSNGLSRYHGKAFTAFSAKQGLPQNYITSITEDELGNLWLGTMGSGLIRYDGENFFPLTTDQGMPNNFLTSIILDKAGNLWIGLANGGGASRFDGQQHLTRFTTKQGLAADDISAMSLDSAGNIWIATHFGVCRYDGKEFITYTKTQGLSDNAVNTITTDSKGNLWFGTLAGGVSRFDGKSFTTFTTSQGLAGNNVYGIEEDQYGNLWFATTTGLSRFDGSTLLSFNSIDGLPDDVVVNITEDQTGTIWLGTNKGFCSLKFKTPLQGKNPVEIKGAGLFNKSNEELKTYELVCTIYNEKSGYPVKDMIYTGSMKFKKRPFPKGRKDEPGILWASTGNAGLIRFDPQSEKKNTGPATPFIKSVKVNEQAINWYDLERRKKDSSLISRQEEIVFGHVLVAKTRDSLHAKFSSIQFDSITPFYQLPLGLVLPYHHNNLTIDYGAIETNRNFMVRYQYVLEGYDEDWNLVTGKSSVSYGNISEGSYTFRLKALSPEGIWSETITYAFKVRPPWWRTWWMHTLYALVSLSVLWAFIIWRLNTLKKEKIKLEKKVTIRTHELREEKDKVEKTLTELKSTQAQLIQSEKMASLGELTAGIAHEIQNPLNFVNNFSEVSNELIEELKGERQKAEGERDTELENEILNDISQNLEKINHHGKRAGDIVKGMLQHSQKSSGQKEPTDINALCDEYLRLAYHGLRAKDKSFNAIMKTDFDESIGNINVIPQDIGRVLLNLYNNAFYAVNEKKKQQPDNYEPTVSVSTNKINGKVEIRVTDNGNGIPQNLVDKIFQPFFTTKPTGQGTGLGLSLSYDIIKAHGGEIEVKSKEDEGSEFIIVLPA